MPTTAISTKSTVPCMPIHALGSSPVATCAATCRAKQCRFPERPIAAPDLEGQSATERESSCREYAQSMPGARQLFLDAGDFCLYRNTLWHIGNYVPYAKRATLHDAVDTDEFAAWRDETLRLVHERQAAGTRHGESQSWLKIAASCIPRILAAYPSRKSEMPPPTGDGIARVRPREKGSWRQDCHHDLGPAAVRRRTENPRLRTQAQMRQRRIGRRSRDRNSGGQSGCRARRASQARLSGQAGGRLKHQLEGGICLPCGSCSSRISAPNSAASSPPIKCSIASAGSWT